jgi:pimeloyl-ACP methyl ester carboxylesterase
VLGEILVDVRAGDRTRSTPAVLVLHGFKGFKDWGMFPPLCERLARSGFAAVSFNVSGSGVDDAGEFSLPDRFGHNTFSAEMTDVGTVLAALDAGDLGVPRPSSVGLVGHSRGGGVGVLAARRYTRLAALVTWAAISTVDRWDEAQRRQWRAMGRVDIVNARTGQVLPMYCDTLDDIEANAGGWLDVPAAAAALRIPWLIVHGDRDESVPVAEAEQLAASAASPVELLRIETGGHTFGAVHPFAGPTPELDRVFEATVRFLGSHLS